MKPLEGKVALITGGGRGLGLTYALRLGELGARLAVCDKFLDAAHEYDAEAERLVDGSLEKTLRQSCSEILLSQVDVTDRSRVKEFVETARERLGRLDIIVNNAGGGGNLGSSKASELGEKDMRAAFARNFDSAVFTTTAAAPFLKAQKSGKVINVASFMGVISLSGGQGADYAASKAAIVSYTRYLAQDLAPFGVTANAIAPGFIATGQFEARFGADTERHAEWRKSIPLGRFGTPEDCANVVEFLATSLSDYVTGQVICVDGGLVRGAS